MGFESNEAELPSAVWLKFDAISNHGASQIDIVSSQSPGFGKPTTTAATSLTTSLAW